MYKDSTPSLNAVELRKLTIDNSQFTIHNYFFIMNNDLTYKEIFRFYLPLVLNAQMMFLSAPVINFGLSRTLDPEVAIAAYSVGFSVMVFLNSPSIASRNISTALINNRTSFVYIRKIFLLCGCLITLSAASIAVTSVTFRCVSRYAGRAGRYCA